MPNKKTKRLSKKRVAKVGKFPSNEKERIIELRKNTFAREGYPYQVELRVASSNPPVRDRTNCLNARLCNQAGERRLLVHPDSKQLIQDLERVHWRSDANGNMLSEIDKSDPARSHASDALGYMIAQDFAMRPRSGEMPGWAR